MKTIIFFTLMVLGVTFRGNAQDHQHQGCYFGNTSLPTHNLRSSSGNPSFDAINQREYDLLASIFNVRPNFFYLLDEGSPNAYATSEITNNGFPDGTVMLGFSLVQIECLNSPSGTCSSIPIILAHEFAHIIDYKYGTGLSGKNKELFADFLAGSYLFHRANTLGWLNIQEVASSFFSKGNYDFNNPNFHGTPQQRFSCLNAGYTLAQQYAVNKQYLSLPILMSSAVQYVSRF